MPVVVCSSCQVKINVKDEQLGRKAKCPKCSTLILLQAAAAAPEKAARRATAALQESPIRSKAPTPKPKSSAAPPPLPSAEVDEEFEDADDVRVQSKPKRSSEIRDDADDEEPRGKKRRGRRDDEDYDFDDDDRDDDRRSRRSKRSGGRWAGVRSGLQLAFFAVMALIVSGALMNILSIFAPAAIMAAAPQGNPRFNQPANFNNVAASARILSVLVMVLGMSAFIAYITHFVGQCFCISAPFSKAAVRAKMSVFTLVGAIVAGILSVCVISMVGVGAAMNMAQQVQQNPQNQQIVAQNAIGSAMGLGLVSMVAFLVVGGLALASSICWILFHASVADAFRDRALQSNCHMFLAAALIAPFVNMALNFALVAIISSPTTLYVFFIMNRVINVAILLGLGFWYITINRRVVRLIDSGRD